MTEQTQTAADTEDRDRLLSPDEVAAILGGGMSRDTVIRCWKRWGLVPHRFGKFLRWRAADVTDYINSHRAA